MKSIRLAAALTVVGLGLAACTGASPHHSPAATAYLALAEPANDRLDHALDALHGPDRDDLTRARHDLLDVATVERAFDRSLLRLRLSGAASTTARNLVAVNGSRAALTRQAAGSTSLVQLHQAEAALPAADELVEAQVGLLRRQLHLPPPDDD